MASLPEKFVAARGGFGADVTSMLKFLEGTQAAFFVGIVISRRASASGICDDRHC
jgi:hypothetical protein